MLRFISKKLHLVPYFTLFKNESLKLAHSKLKVLKVIIHTWFEFWLSQILHYLSITDKLYLVLWYFILNRITLEVKKKGIKKIRSIWKQVISNYLYLPLPVFTVAGLNAFQTIVSQILVAINKEIPDPKPYPFCNNSSSNKTIRPATNNCKSSNRKVVHIINIKT